MIVMPPTPSLETARLLLEPISMRDVPAVQRRFPRWEIVRQLGARVPWPYPPDGAESFLRTLLNAMEAGRKNAWGLWLKGGPNEVIGIIELWPPVDEVPFAFVSGEELRQVWLLKAEDWKKRSR